MASAAFGASIKETIKCGNELILRGRNHKEFFPIVLLLALEAVNVVSVLKDDHCLAVHDRRTTA